MERCCKERSRPVANINVNTWYDKAHAAQKGMVESLQQRDNYNNSDNSSRHLRKLNAVCVGDCLGENQTSWDIKTLERGRNLHENSQVQYSVKDVKGGLGAKVDWQCSFVKQGSKLLKLGYSLHFSRTTWSDYGNGRKERVCVYACMCVCVCTHVFVCVCMQPKCVWLKTRCVR